jgi:hypothetical protein
MNEHGELARVAEEEDGGVVEDPVPVTLLSVELAGKSSGVASTVRRALFTSDGGKADECLCLFANSLEHVDDSDITDIVGDLKLAVGACTLGVNYSLWDTLTVEVGEDVDEVEILQK